ncbi:hypothetical protein C8R45DRAFT_1189504 [Mycena sanguinolenta]|nr:hypothetical protein C8R45DRAFT_1189504 [Mycena sanguinolenta]
MTGTKKNKSKEVQNVQGDIDEIVDGLDPAVRQRWFGYKPTSSSSSRAQYSPLPSPDKPVKPSKSKRKSIDENAQPNSDSEIEVIPSRPNKRVKTSSPEFDEHQDEDDDSVEMTCYLYVETPAPPVLHVRKAPTKSLPPQTTDLGPFLFQSSIGYTDFLRILADGHTKVANLATSTIKWKFDRPSNAAKKSLANETGFKAMIKSLQDRHKDYVFSVFMAPPSPVKQELPWLLNEHDVKPGGSTLDFEYNLDATASSSVKSIRDQISSIDNSSSQDLNDLLDKYPVDNNPLFPGKHIYQNETGYFELTDIKLRVWAVAKASGKAILEAPPNSAHFSRAQTIKPPRASDVPAPFPSLPTAPSDTSALQLLLAHPNLAQMLNQFHGMPFGNPYMQYPFPPPHPYAPAPVPVPQPVLATQPSMETKSVPVELPRVITLQEFFERYKVIEDDQRILVELGYIPGDDGITDVDAATWESVKVAPLARGRILRLHSIFLKDIEKGLWDSQ